MPKSVLTRGRSWVARITVLAMVASLMALAIPAGAQVQDTSSACPEAEIPSAGFTDLGGLDATTVQAIDCLVFYGISQGTSATTFSPTLAVPRWQMALFLTRQAEVHGLTLGDGSPQGFTDIAGLPADVQLAINQLAQLGVTQGTSATTFSPFDLVSRWQMALFISRLVAGAGITLPDGSPQGYTDIVSLSAEAQTAINQVTQLGIAQGTSATTFVPFAATLRWHMALFLTRTLAADGITPAVTLDTFTDAPELISVEEESYDDGEEELVLIYTFDEEIDFVDEVGNFRVYEADHTGPEEGDDSEVDGDQVTVTFENIDEDDYEDLSVATVAAEAVEDLDGDANPEGAAPYKDVVIGASAGELDTGFNLVSVTHDDSGGGDGTANFIFQYDDDVLAGDVNADAFVIIRDNGDEETCDFLEDSTVDDDLDDDELMIECPGEVIPDDEWARGLDDLAVIEAADALWQAADDASTDAPDLVSVEQVGDVRVEFLFDERVKFFDGEDDTDDSTAADEATILAGFAIYDEDGNTINPERAIVTNSDRTVRVEFADDDASPLCGGDCDDDTVGFGDGDDDLDGDVEGGIIDTGIVEERTGDEEPNARDEARTGAGDDVNVPAGVTAGADLESVGDIEVSDTDIDGDASEWEAVFTFSEDVSEVAADCDPALFRIYTEDGTVVEGTDCDADNDEVTVTFDEDDVEDGVIGTVAFAAVEAEDNGQPNVEGVAPTEFAG